MERRTGEPRQVRADRLAQKFKGVLRCEWCGRWSTIAMKRWYQMYDAGNLFPAKYTFWCDRERCIRERCEFLPEREQDLVRLRLRLGEIEEEQDVAV